ncbi:MAG: tRNA (adenosine(37)-N6)-threonylcarbamoyltransferase complex ATPase subunit type 1 TsaE [Leptospiraceae bacterium]|nr:MAG: tRNA (adenosine(37)-N6)-threonylcarbamoyltransferase complex ATPase subunit type 1 TsaE [Leptospiraceae bacterium]
MEKEEIINQFCKNQKETEECIIAFFNNYLINHKGVILLLEGNLGAGKTTITKTIGKLLHINQIINSPSFNIYNIYTNEKNALLHYDLYRISHLELEEMELRELWNEQYENKFTVHAIEWWQKAQYIQSNLPIYLIQIEQNINQFTERTLRIFKICGNKYELS